jgi:lipoprotein-anchoring transpeptidase ErfK/SrfK
VRDLRCKRSGSSLLTGMINLTCGVGPDMENGIHAQPVMASRKTLWADSLGKPTSYGCVVLITADAKQLFNWAEIGTTVEIRP